MHVLIRVDGGPTRGFGHLVRTSTVANRLVDRDHRVTCLTHTPDAARSVYADGIPVVELPLDGEVEATLDRIGETGADVLVSDLPDTSIEDQRRFAESDAVFVVVRDDVGGTVCCDVLLNSHIYAEPGAYDWIGDEPVWCVGGEFNIVDGEIRAVAAREPRWQHPPERALITMGGSDVRGTTPDVLRAFADFELALDVVVGPGFDDETVAAIREARRTIAPTVEIHRDPDDFGELMYRADFAVTALGLTAYELLAVGTPIVGTPQAPDQEPKAETLREEAVAIVLSRDATVPEITEAITTMMSDEDSRRRFQRRGRELVSVDGVDRFVTCLERLVG